MGRICKDKCLMEAVDKKAKGSLRWLALLHFEYL